MRCVDSITDSMVITLSKLQKMVKDREPWNATAHGLETTVQLYDNHSIRQLELAESVDVESWTQRAGSTIIHEFSTAQGG